MELVDQKNSPTSLNLFNFTSTQADQVKSSRESLGRFKSELYSASESIFRFRDESFKRGARLAEAGNGLIDDWEYVCSAIACSKFYLKLNEEFSTQGYSEKDIFELFRKCHQYNCYYHEHYGHGQTEAVKRGGKSNQTVKAELRAYAKNIEPPDWYPKDREQWLKFIIDYGSFVSYLNPQLNAESLTIRVSQWRELGCCTFLEMEPDWLRDSNGTPTQKEVVLQELDSDIKQRDSLKKSRSSIEAQIQLLDERLEEKSRKVNKWIKERECPFIKDTDQLFDQVIYIDYRDFCVKRKDSGNHSLNRQFFVDLVYGSSRQLSNEYIALWLEDRLAEGELITSAQDLLNPQHYSLLRHLIEKASCSKPSEVNPLRILSKKGYRIFTYDLLPMVSSLEPSSLPELLEWVDLFEGSSAENIIWAISQFVSGQRDFILRNEDQLSTREYFIDSVSKFSVNWLMTNWRWYLKQIDQLISGKSRREPARESRENGKSDGFRESQEAAELEDDIVHLQGGELTNWQLFYRFNLRTEDQRHWILIPGGTLDDREKALAELIARYKIPTTRGARILIDRLERIVSLEGYDEDTMHHYQDDKVRVDKYDIGHDMRILYHKDPDTKTLVFLLYKKTERSYRPYRL